MSLILNGTDGISDVDGTAATPAIRGTDANTGIYFGSDIIGFSEGGTQCGEFDASANFKFNSGYGSVATAYGCRAWVNFNGQGTVAIRASGNVSSITDNGTGNYNVNFTTSMPDANYSAVCSGSDLSAGTVVIPKVFNASNVNILTLANDGTGAGDAIFACVSIFR
jgi:hypothetical protein